MTLTKTSGRRWTPLSIAALVLGFIVWWPLGIALAAYILWGGNVDGQLRNAWDEITCRKRPFYGFMPASPSSGNQAFDDYRRATLHRLEEEQQAFAAHVERLRAARDQEEFDRFMAERSLQRTSE
ncbi:hypothetical protein FHS85_001828 [Rhodoligotrophos appendicifer]|uniref:DUF2852 domain-containing protein n=1 Tax=Rhodoligotrophos appendicifer TaxID=987056 RepID=UPI001186E83E|nr:DUF2852 domain-containing protein [Rhodoligotrophos appendicifer]